jgi:glycosyltransferase involved in cell wall biosynthesis
MHVTVLIPTIPGREVELARAVASVPAGVPVVVEMDERRAGAAATRNRALERVETEWVAFLDDDDEFYPHHLKACLRCARFSKADVVYPGYDTVGEDPVNCFGIPFNATMLRRVNFIPVTALVRTEMALRVGGFAERPDVNGDPCEDWGLWLRLLDAGAKFAHLPVKTWLWRVDGGTRGRGEPLPS